MARPLNQAVEEPEATEAEVGSFRIKFRESVLPVQCLQQYLKCSFSCWTTSVFSCAWTWWKQALLNGFDDILVDSTTLSDFAWQEFLNQMNVKYGWPWWVILYFCQHSINKKKHNHFSIWSCSPETHDISWHFWLKGKLFPCNWTPFMLKHVVLGAALRFCWSQARCFKKCFEKTNLFFVCVVVWGFLQKNLVEKKSLVEFSKVKWCCLWTAASCVRESDLEVFDVSFLQAPAFERMRSTGSMGFQGFRVEVLVTYNFWDVTNTND